MTRLQERRRALREAHVHACAALLELCRASGVLRFEPELAEVDRLIEAVNGVAMKLKRVRAPAASPQEGKRERDEQNYPENGGQEGSIK